MMGKVKKKIVKWCEHKNRNYENVEQNNQKRKSKHC